MDLINILSIDDTVAMRQYLSEGGDINVMLPVPVSNSFSPYPLINQAVYLRAPRCLEVLIEFGANLESIGDGYTPLLLACFLFHVEEANILLRHGASVHATIRMGGPLHCLELCYQERSIEDEISFVKNLIDHGADPDLCDRFTNKVAGFWRRPRPLLDDVLRNYRPVLDFDIKEPQ